MTIPMSHATGKPFPDREILAGDDGCGPVTVVVQTAGGRGGDPVYAGGFIKGHTGSNFSMMSAEQMRRLAAALNSAADRIQESGLPSYQELSEKRQARKVIR